MTRGSSRLGDEKQFTRGYILLVLGLAFPDFVAVGDAVF